MLSRTLVLVSALLYAGATLALERAERVIAGGPSDSIEVRHLILKGTNEEIGRALAEIGSERYRVQLSKTPDTLRTRAMRRYIERNDPILYERMKGVAAYFDSKLDDDSIDHSQLGFTDLRGGCSIAYLPPSVTATKKGVMSRDYDFTTGALNFGPLPPGQLHPTARPYLLELYPDRGYASIAMVAYDLLSGVLDGMNSEGLTVSLALDADQLKGKSMDPTLGPAPGLGVLQTLRLLLDTCANVDQAKETLMQTKQYYEFVPVHYLIADRFGNSFIWEYSAAHNKEYIIENPGKPLIMTNFTISPHMAGGRPPSAEEAKPFCKRYAYLTARLGAGELISEELLNTTHKAVDAQRAIGADPNPPERTFWHALYFPEERRVKISYYLRDDGTKIVRSDYVEFALNGALPQMQSAQLQPSPRAQEDSAVLDQLRAAGAVATARNVKFKEGTDPTPLLPLLRKMPKLVGIDFAGTQIDDSDLEQVGALTNLEQLGLRSTSVTDAGLAHLTKLSRLEILILANDNVTDAGLAHLSKITTFTGLVLNNTKVTDAGLLHLKTMPKLTKVNVTNTAVTAEGAAAAKKLMPFWATVIR